MLIRLRTLLVLLVLTHSACAMAQRVVAATPPMGWNSWDSYGLTITEAQFHANAEVLRDRLKPFGWNYAVVDEGWYMENPEQRPHPEKLVYALDEHGRFLPSAKRFPSAAGQPSSAPDGQVLLYQSSHGLAELGRWTHAQGLKFGIHIIRGIPKESVRLNLPIEGAPFTAQDAADTGETCPWDPTSYGVRDNAAGQAWYDALIRQYAGWGVDFLKVDCIADHPYRASEIRQLHAAVRKSGRDMVLSLSPGPTSLAHAREVQDLSQMWRISNDVWDEWRTTASFPDAVSSQFARLAQWAPYAGPGHWPDADMLPFGTLAPKPDVGPGARRSRLSAAEQRTQLTLWAIARSPLFLGANLTMLDADTLALLTRPDVLLVNQTALASKQVHADEHLVVWLAELPHGQRAAAFFNVSDEQASLPKGLEGKGITLRPHTQLRDAWSGRAVQADSLAVTLAPHACALYLWQD